jgi:3-oxoacyl-[acyl-carrier protein] reductase
MVDRSLRHELAGRRILVTGASSGIGAAAAAAFGKCGATVCVHYHVNAEGAEATRAAVEAAGGRAIVMQRDLTERGAGARLVEEAAGALGGLDVLVNNAGDMLERRPLENVGDAEFDRIIDLNIRPVVSACAAAIPYLRHSPAGAIINVTSISARIAASRGGNLYAATKGFISAYTRGLARELAPDRIRVNAVSPGVIETPLHTRWTPPELFAQTRATIPLGRVGQPDDCAGAFVFLASSSLAGYMTGQVLEVNGGQFMA